MTVTGISADGAKLIGWSTVPVPIATLAVILRFKSRRILKRIGADDWTMLAALFLYYGLYISLVIWAPIGKAGFPQSELSYDQIENLLKVFFCVQLFYGWVGPAIKLSFLLLYRRIFVVPWFMCITLIVSALVVGWSIAVTFSVIFECWPVGSYWQPLLQQHCIDSQKFYWGNGIANMLLDVIILCLPIPVIWRLQMSARKKISITIILALGIFICTASILRITYLWFIAFDDISGTIAIPSIWSSIEPGLGIFCGCLPTFPALLRQWSKQYSAMHSGSQGGLLSFMSSRFRHTRGSKRDRQHRELSDNSTVELSLDQNVETWRTETTESRSVATKAIV